MTCGKLLAPWKNIKVSINTGVPFFPIDSQTSPPNGKSSGNFFMNGISKVTAKGARMRGRSLDRAGEPKGGSNKLNSWMKSRDKSLTGNQGRSSKKSNSIPSCIEECINIL